MAVLTFEKITLGCILIAIAVADIAIPHDEEFIWFHGGVNSPSGKPTGTGLIFNETIELVLGDDAVLVAELLYLHPLASGFVLPLFEVVGEDIVIDG